MKLHQRSQQGSIFVVVIAAVSIAAMIAVSYLFFANDHRERAGRQMDQARTQIRLEQAVLEAKRQIVSQAKTTGIISLDTVAIPGKETEPGDLVKFSLDGIQNGTKQLSQFANSTQLLTSLNANGDPFFGAKAIVSTVDVGASANTSGTNQSRLAGKNVTLTPVIEVREIPVSQFTLFSLYGSVSIDPTIFGGNAGRIYGAQNVTISGAGNLVVDYPVVSGGNIETGSGKLSVKTSDGSGTGNETQIDVSNQTAYKNPIDDSEGAWLAMARTSYDSALITPSTLPVDIALVPAADAATDLLDIERSGLRCSLELTVNVDQPDTRGYYPILTNRSESGWVAPKIPETVIDKYKLSSQPTHQDVPFVAKNSEVSGQTAQIVVAFNYAVLPDVARNMGSIYIHAIHNSGLPADALLLIRGAADVTHDLSIVSPHAIIIAGDFNSSANPSAASIITSLNVQTADSAVGNADFGSVP
jgi:hypothetical protein